MGSEASGWIFPTLSVHILRKAFEVCSMWFQMGPRWDRAQVSLVAPSSVMQPLSWLSLIPVLPIQSHGTFKNTLKYFRENFQLPPLPRFCTSLRTGLERKGLVPGLSHIQCIFTYFLHLIVGKIQEASCCPIWQTGTSRHNMSIRFKKFLSKLAATGPDQRTGWSQKNVPIWFCLSMSDKGFRVPTFKDF